MEDLRERIPAKYNGMSFDEAFKEHYYFAFRVKGKDYSIIQNLQLWGINGDDALENAREYLKELHPEATETSIISMSEVPKNVAFRI